jgi:pSer/pThr/pTyr-binding forkhead associated (FHA) protein
MNQHQPTATQEHAADAGSGPQTGTTDKHAAGPATQPYLKIFGVDIGVLEFELKKATVTIGRSNEADIPLPNRSVSRHHARIVREDDRYTLVDVRSTSGTTVNGTAVDSHILQDGDSIQVGTYTLQFHTHRVSSSEAAAAQAKSLLRGNYCTLPKTTQAKYRVLSLDSSMPFDSGNTLKIGQGGVLIPTSDPPGDVTCLELVLSITARTDRRFLGEIMGVIQAGEIHWVCVKLHSVSKADLEVIVAGAKPGAWVEVAPI